MFLIRMQRRIFERAGRLLAASAAAFALAAGCTEVIDIQDVPTPAEQGDRDATVDARVDAGGDAAAGDDAFAPDSDFEAPVLVFNCFVTDAPYVLGPSLLSATCVGCVNNTPDSGCAGVLDACAAGPVCSCLTLCVKNCESNLPDATAISCATTCANQLPPNTTTVNAYDCFTMTCGPSCAPL